MVLDHIAAMVRYWLNESRTPSAAEKLDGLAFSFLTMIDGDSGFMPAFDLIPGPHEDDQEDSRSEGENWWPEGVNISDGSLHEQWCRIMDGFIPAEASHV